MSYKGKGKAQVSGGSIGPLLEETSHYDPDKRYMAISDLSAELERAGDAKFDSAMERRICDAILARLETDEKSNDVQAIAVKCLSVLMKRVQEAQVVDVAEKLCHKILAGPAELRDIYSIGLKGLINDIQPGMGPRVSDAVSQRLLTGMRSADPGTLVDILDVTTELLKRFGPNMDNRHGDLTKLVLQQLHHAQPVVRKRSIACLGQLAVHVSDPLLQSMVEHLLAGIKAPKDTQDAPTLIRTIGTVSRQVGHRLGRHLGDIVPLFMNFVAEVPEEAADEAADDLREHCYQALESFVLRCPAEVTPFLPAVLTSVRGFLEYDPNYTYSDDMEDEEEDEYDDYSDEYDDMGGYSDDNDSSWKVRRAAAKVLAAIIQSRPELLSALYAPFDPPPADGGPGTSHARQLVDRFKEREESVALAIISCFTELLRATVVLEGAAAQTTGITRSLHDTVGLADPGAGAAAASAADSSLASAAAAGLLQPPPLRRQRSSFDSLVGVSEDAVTASLKLLKSKEGKDAKVKIAVWTMMRQLALALGPRISPSLPILMPALATSLTDHSSSAIRFEALLCLRMVLDTNAAESFAPHIGPMVEAVTACATDDWYKIVAESLRVIGRLAVVMRPRAPDGTFAPTPAGVDLAPTVTKLYDAVLPRLRAHDIDQEIKECAITSMGLVLAHVGDFLTPQLSDVLPVFLERLGNEITRAPVLKALSFVACSPLSIDLSSIQAAAVKELGTFLRQQARSLKQSTLVTLTALVHSHGASLDADLLTSVLSEAAGLVSDVDLPLSHLAHQLCVAVIATHPTGADLVHDTVLTRAVTLSCSPLLQGNALASLQALFQALLASGAAGCGYADLIDSVLTAAGARTASGSAGGGGGGGAGAGAGASSGAGAGAGEDPSGYAKASAANAARIAAVLSAHASDAECGSTIEAMLKQLGSSSATDQLLALFVLGEIGWRRDVPTAHPTAVEALQGLFNTDVEDVKMAAAFALGGICVGNMTAGISVVLEALASGLNPYLVLTAVKEILNRHAPSSPEGPAFDAHVDTLFPLLIRTCDNPDDGVRNIVAECLGKLSMVAPAKVIPSILEDCGNANPLTRWTAVSSIKTAVSSPATHGALRSGIATCLATLRDEDLAVRQAALLTLNAIVHVQPDLVHALVVPVDEPMTDEGGKTADEPAPPVGDVNDIGVLPFLYYEMQTRPSLKREVNLGPFKHTEDDGLPLRKASFAAIDSILEHMRERVGRTFLTYLRAGLQDENLDVQLLCHQLLAKLAGWSLWQRHVLAELDGIATALGPALKSDPSAKGGSGREDVVRSALRAVDALARIPDAASVRGFAVLAGQCEATPHLAALLEGIRVERGAVAGSSLLPGSGSGAGAGGGAGFK